MTTIMPMAVQVTATLMLIVIVLIAAMNDSKNSSIKELDSTIEDAYNGWGMKLLKIIYYSHFAVIILAGIA